MCKYDIAIIGLGPAGSIFARLLNPTFSVIAIDKKSASPDSFRKPCGGLLSPDAQKEVALLGLNMPKDILVDPQIFSVKTIDLDSGLCRSYQRMYLNLDRHKFDLWLQSLIPPHVTVEKDSAVSNIRRNGENYTVTYKKNGETLSVSASFVVGADGANSLLRRFLYPKIKFRSYVSVQQWFSDQNPHPFYSCVFDSVNTDCYSWAVSKDGKFIFGGAYPYDSPRKRFENQKEKLQAFGFEFGDPEKTEACLVLRPKSLRHFRLGKDRAFFIGEAAGFVSPSSLEGISSAIKSARLLAGVLNSGCANPNKRYAAAAFSLRLKLWLKLLKCPFMFRPFLRRLVMKSGLQSLKVENDIKHPECREKGENDV